MLRPPCSGCWRRLPGCPQLGRLLRLWRQVHRVHAFMQAMLCSAVLNLDHCMQMPGHSMRSCCHDTARFVCVAPAVLGAGTSAGRMTKCMVSSLPTPARVMHVKRNSCVAWTVPVSMRAHWPHAVSCTPCTMTQHSLCNYPRAIAISPLPCKVAVSARGRP